MPGLFCQARRVLLRHIEQLLQERFLRRRLRRRAQDEEIAQVQQQAHENLRDFFACLELPAETTQGRGGIALQDRLGPDDERLLLDRPQEPADVLLADRALAEADRLLQQHLRIAQAALSRARDGVERGLIGADPLGLADLLQRRDDGLGIQAAKVKTLAAGEDRRREFLRRGRGEDELHVRGRLLQRLEQGVERLGGEHVDLVDDVDAVRPVRRGELDRLAKRAHFVDAAVGGAVDFDHVEAVALADGRATGTGLAGLDGGPLGAGEGFGENPRGGGLAHPPLAGKQIRLPDPLGFDGAAEGGRDVRLADEVGKNLGPVFTGQGEVRHQLSLSGLHRTFFEPFEERPILLIAKTPAGDQNQIHDDPDAAKPSERQRHQEARADFPNVKSMGSQPPQEDAQQQGNQA